MPINQPTQVIQRPWNNVNVSGAILTPFAQGIGTGLGEAASSGLKYLLGIQSPQEAYYQAEADAKRQSTDDKIRESLTNLRSNPNYNPADDKKYALAYTDGDEERAQRILDSTLDTPEAHGKREIGWAYDTSLSNERRPTPFGTGAAAAPAAPAQQAGPISSALSATTAPEQIAALPEVTQDKISAQAPLPAPAPAEDPAKQATSAAINQAQETSSEQLSLANAPTPLTPAPEVLTPAAPGGLLESAPQGMTQPQPMTDEQRQQFGRDLQAYQTRLQGMSALYQQSMLALTKGDVDPKATANALNLANMHTNELTKLIQTAAPSFGLPTVDMDGKILDGNFAQDGYAAAYLSKFEALRLSDPGKFDQLLNTPEGKTMYDGLKQASERWQARLGRLPADAAFGYQEKVIKNSAELIPFSVLANYSVATAQNEETKRANQVAEGQRDRQLTAFEQQVASETGLRNVQTEEARFNLGILQKYRPQEASLKIKEMEQRLKENEMNLASKTLGLQKDKLVLDMAALEAVMDITSKGEQTFFNNQTKFIGNLELQLSKNMKDRADLEKTYALKMNGWRVQMEAAQKTMTPDKVDAYIRTTAGEDATNILKRPADERFEYWFAHTNSDYKKYYDLNQQYKDNINRLTLNINEAMTKTYQSPIGKDTMDAANMQARQAINAQVQDGMRNFAKAALKNSADWADALNEHSTAVNDIVSGWVQTGNSFRPKHVWNDAQSKNLAHLTQWSITRGSKLGVEDFKNVPIPLPNGGTTTIGKELGGRVRDYYNAYNKLYTEMKS